MKKRILILLTLCIFAILPVRAQEALQYGTPITAEMTAELYEFTYTFEGKLNDVVVVAMIPVDALGDLNNTQLTLQTASGDVLATYQSFGSNRVFAQLPETAAYTVIATRPDGAAGADVGEFTLSVDSIPMIEIGASIPGTISSEDTAHYYAYNGDTDFYISYRKSAGDFFPEVSVNSIGFVENDGQLNAVGSISGGSVTLGSIGTFAGSQLYVIEVDEALFDFNFSEVTADYTLDVLDAAKLQ